MTHWKRKRRGLRLHQGIMIVLVIALAIGLVLFAKRYHRQWDWTATGQFTLSEQTIKVLEGLKAPVRLVTFFKKDSPEAQSFKDLMTSYLYYGKQLSVEEVDPDRDPSQVKAYGIREYGTVYVETEGRHVETTTLSEEGLTGAIIGLLENKVIKIGVLSGHGERSVADQDAQGLALFSQDLAKSHYTIEVVNLLQTGKIPEDVALLIIPTSTHPLLAQEQEAVEAYLKRDGTRALVLLDLDGLDSSGVARVPAPTFLSQLPIESTGEVVIDPSSRLFGGDYAVPIVSEYPSHAITSALKAATFFPLAQPLIEAPASDDSPWQVSPLAKTGPEAWGEKGSLKEAVEYTQGTDRQGPLVLAYALERLAQDKSIPVSRVVVVGDSDFLANAYYNQAGNSDFAKNIVHWLASEESLIAAHPRGKIKGELNLSPAQARLIFGVFVLAMPVAMLVVAFFFWRKRRKK